MSTSKGTDTQKYHELTECVEHNRQLLNAATVVAIGNVIIVDGLQQIPPYSTVVLSPKDQLLLAADKIDYPEIRASFTPALSNNEHNGGYMYNATFSMNGGDMPAMRRILEVVKPETLIVFNVDGYPHEIRCQLEKYDVDEISISFMSDVDGHKLVDGIAAHIVVRTDASGSGDTEWMYVIQCHCVENEPPTDNSLRGAYSSFQAAIRSILSSFGVAPRALNIIRQRRVTSIPLATVMSNSSSTY